MHCFLVRLLFLEVWKTTRISRRLKSWAHAPCILIVIVSTFAGGPNAKIVNVVSGIVVHSKRVAACIASEERVLLLPVATCAR